jgi:acylphosphatase
MREKAARRLRVYGKVQGVFYRAWAIETARSLGINGWVRNRLDGTVEILAVGTEADIALLVERCREGPPAARVDDIVVEDTAGIVAEGFTQKPTV